jgi:DNA polymerase/3'-5' exonuclease PolX
MSNKELIISNLELLRESKKNDRFRLLAYSNGINILKRYKPINKNDITTEDLANIKKLKGIGKGLFDKIKEILESDQLNYKLKAVLKIPEKSNKEKILDLFMSILGVGEKTALNWYDQGYKKLDDIKKIELNRTQKIGLKYHTDLQLKIPRIEIKCGYQLYIQYVLTKISKEYNLKFQFVIAGSYRRKKSFSNDIDVLITEKTETIVDKELMDIIIKEFVKYKLIIEELTKGKSKFTGLSEIKLSNKVNFPVRRFDIELVRANDWYYALLYFTGSKSTNENMRLTAKKQGYLLNQYGLFSLTGNKKRFDAKSENDIFKKLKLDYLLPEER